MSAELEALLADGPAAVPTTLREAALYYAGIGWRVFPIDPDSKQPITEHGHLDATADVEQVRAWWGATPSARVGVHLRASGLIAIDVDVADGKPGLVSLDRLEADYGPLPRTNVQRSGRGGLHVIMADPSPGPDGWTRPQREGGACRGKLDGYPAVDVKLNGYVVLSPSGSYAWVEHDPARVEPVPERWIGILRKPAAELADLDADGIEKWAASTDAPLGAEGAKALREALRKLGPRGAGGNTTWRAVRTIFHDWGCSLDEGTPYLEAWNAASGSPHSASELERQLRQIAEKPEDPARGLRGHARHGISWSAKAARAGTRDEVAVVRAPDRAPTDTAPSEPPASTARDRLGRRVGTGKRGDRAPIRRYPTGFPSLDRLTGGGVATRQVAVLMAPPADGKSAKCVQLARHLQGAVPVLYASTELETDEVEARIAAPVLGVPWTHIVDGRVPPERVDAALASLRIHVLGCEVLPRGDDALDAIEAEVRAITAEEGATPVVFVDYLQDLARGVDAAGVRAKVGDLAQRLRAMAQALDAAFVVVSSVSRAYYGTARQEALRNSDDASVYLAAAKESGDVDYAAAVVLFLDVMVREGEADFRAARIAVAKSRHGRTGFVGARFYGATGRWEEHGLALAAMAPAARAERRNDAKLADAKDRVFRAIQKKADSWRSVRDRTGLQNAIATEARTALEDEKRIEKVEQLYTDKLRRSQKREVWRATGADIAPPVVA
ncbi:MAG: bifunctional DNA primase/polymerase [Deltaproteobacteria bacterium]|nr:bifunctional DNA primase/polymerase [Deltaproteobacteria bacterium]